jgi:hypothetical protein
MSEQMSADIWDRVIVGRKEPVILAPGITLDPIKPGGKDGPGGCVRQEHPGGKVWQDFWFLGTEKDDFQLSIPDIRMPANQYWPLHWHDCWIAVVVLDGSCLVGDWWMQPGDVIVTEAELEYGPLVVGPSGAQIFEVFAKHHLLVGGYAPEFHDHPTLAGGPFVFTERAPVNRRNAGKQVLKNDGVPGIFKGRLAPGARFDLGPPDDPERGIMLDTRLGPSERIAPHSYRDWRAIFVLDGAMRLGDRDLVKNDAIFIEPGAPVGPIEAGRQGAQLLEVTRTAAGLERVPKG